MSFELALGLWTVVMLLALVSAVYLVITVQPDRRDSWDARLKRRAR